MCPPPTAAATARVEIERLVPGRYEFRVENEGPVVVRVAEKYDPGWKATVNGKPAEVLRVDYMFQGLFLPGAGRHEIVLRNAPSSLPVMLQMAGLLAGLGAAAALAARRFRA